MGGLRDWLKKRKDLLAWDKRPQWNSESTIPDRVVDPRPAKRFDNPERDILTDPGPWTDRKRKFWRT